MRLAQLTAVTFGLAFAVAACHHADTGPAPTMMHNSEKIPAAKGSFVLGDGGNGNTNMHLSVQHLAPPDKVATGATTYVVWIKPLASDGQAQNVGALKVGDDEQGQIDSITPWKTFEVWVTAEGSPGVQEPKGTRVLWGRAGE